tara:strand:+ start:38133 stop:38741 length:609 start_codon:yes stop_codon:yes gene_type:complete
MAKTIIGISGVAGAGKDLFFSLLQKHLPVKRFALADSLKNDVRGWCVNRYGIDPTECSRDDKEKIRDFLVFHGTFMRAQTKGRYWIDKLDYEVRRYLNSWENIPVITDIRYQEHPEDEVTWIKKELKGVIVHVSQYQLKDDKRVWKCPVNSEEQRQDPILKNHADFSVEWEKIKCDNPLESEYLNKEVEKFATWYHEKTDNK